MAGPPRQLPLDLGHAAGTTRDDLVVTQGNRAAIVLIDGWPDWPAPVTVLVGPPGSGKSHLAAIWRERAGARALDASCLSVDDPGGSASTPILLDDIDSGAIDEPGLFHLLNAARSARTTVLIVSRRFPAAWGLRLPDLASRLKAATLVELQEPDDELLTGVIAKLFADRQVEVEPHVVQYIVHRIERSLSTAIDVVDRLDRAALEGQRRISRALAAEIVTALDSGQRELGI